MSDRATRIFNAVSGAVRASLLRFDDEAGLQRGLAEVFRRYGFDFDDEVRLSDSDRVDFLVGERDTAWGEGPGVAVEVKVDGTMMAAARQVQRYMHSERVAGVLLVTTKGAHLGMPHELGGKPVRVLHYSRGLR